MDYSSMIDALFQKLKDRNNGYFQSEVEERMNRFFKGEGFVLELLLSRGEPVQPGEISAVMRSSTARVAAALSSLEDKGFVSRETDPADRRRVLVSITPAGSKVAVQAQTEIRDHMERVLRAMGEKDAPEFVRLFLQFIDIESENGW